MIVPYPPPLPEAEREPSRIGTTHDPVRFWGSVRPDRVALKSAQSVWTYGDLDRAVWSAADALLERGLGSGEHIALEFEPEDAIAFAVAFHAVQRIGSLPVLIGTAGTEDERQAMRERAQVEYRLNAGDLDIPMLYPPEAGEEQAKGASAERSKEPSRRKNRGSGGSEPPVHHDVFLDRRLDAPAAVLFTSGTSGEPRAAVLTHGNFLWSALASARNLGVRDEDLWLCCMPLHHVGGLSILIRTAMTGTAALLHDHFDAEAVSRTLDEDGVTLVSLVPTMLSRLLDVRKGRHFPSSLRAALIGGGPAEPSLFASAAKLDLRALPTYGLTEAASQVTTLPLREWPRGTGSSGRPLPFIGVEIRDGADRPAGPGVEGEIVVSGPTVMAGYLGDPAATEGALRRRRLRTGDVGMWDEEGRLVVLDRRADRIVTGGENVSPEEVERAIASHPSVRAACVVGVPSREWGQEVAVAVEPKTGRTVTLEAVREHARASLSGFKLPRRFLVLPSLPRSSSGKLLRRVVRDRFLDEMAKQKHP
ncbi:MAG TPA: AMP-binding protein [Candidatus Omnitrophota bacterium]|nr:AMP-binding protein [Candidatus Omnitrophota bacterium]